ncbi:MAG: GTPase ObgE [Thermoguttaceae bacterium]|nr:GTPase ObgE [Thermoguttaceae bacterium]
MFIDEIEITVEAGRGGDGCVSFHREKFVAKGGPDGGDGGHGGSIVLRAASGVNSLMGLTHRKHWTAPNGSPGGADACTGRCGEDRELEVPPGTMVFDASTGLLLKDLDQVDETVVVARGGHGGKGNMRFRSAANQAPRQSTPGADGELRKLRLELKVIADVGLIGKPNAGKSTLLSRLTRARPEIANYPFTTKYPNLGRCQISMDQGFVIADIPGLIEGAAGGAGLGHEFLRHVQRAGVLLHLVEPMPMDGSDPLDNYRKIRRELELFSPELGRRPEIVAVTKADLPEAAALQTTLETELGRPVLCFSSVSGKGMPQLLQTVMQTLNPSEV